MVFHWNLRNSESPQVSRTLLSILADLNNVIVNLTDLNNAVYHYCYYHYISCEFFKPALASDVTLESV